MRRWPVRNGTRNTPGALAGVLLVSLSLLARGGAALPADAHVDIPAGKDKFLRAPINVDGVTTEPEGVLSAELMPSKEIYVSVPAKAQGSVVVLAVADDRVFTWDVCINHCPAATDIASAVPSCPGLAPKMEDGRLRWIGNVSDDRCLAALRQALAHATLPPKTLELNLEEKVALDFFHQVTGAIAADPETKGLVAGYYGPTLELTGTASRLAVYRALAHAWLLTVGDISFDDETTAPDSDSTSATEDPQ